ncbi:YDG/SRA domain-containing protein [Actinopolymorpha rutila]|uniref:Putative restriction endonuclease n=1 Tax=Actinopolymorpha rutila TaxID=446787 RepID=A0A852Z793_9ACTN|nr:YDG/SRA domain-containing protein [Actinopolymorpha rutila]NYH88243.1 putative restriction endonuclease [Actinopolymorpha rutila]
MAGQRLFGELAEHPVGTTYASRKELAAAGVHRVTIQGICGNGKDGSESIVVSGGYEDDEDYGDEIVYTGAGGNDPSSKKQVADQELTQSGNAGLVVSEENGYPVRVIRGWKGDPAFSPVVGYRYDGLFRVAQHWSEVGKSGYRIWRFKLVRLVQQEVQPLIPPANLPAGTVTPRQAIGTTQRIIRTTAVATAVKKLHKYTCQVCGVQLRLPVGLYAEGAHIRALGRPHNGPDTPDNMLCLCANDHALFDLGGIYIDEHLRVRDHAGGVLGQLRTNVGHVVSLEHIRYHREHFGFGS